MCAGARDGVLIAILAIFGRGAQGVATFDARLVFAFRTSLRSGLSRDSRSSGTTVRACRTGVVLTRRWNEFREGTTKSGRGDSDSIADSMVMVLVCLR